MRFKNYLEEGMTKDLEKTGGVAAAKLIDKAEKSKDFGKWLATKPENLLKIYGGKVPTAKAIITGARKGQLKDLIALDNWDAELTHKKTRHSITGK